MMKLILFLGALLAVALACPSRSAKTACTCLNLGARTTNANMCCSKTLKSGCCVKHPKVVAQMNRAKSLAKRTRQMGQKKKSCSKTLSRHRRSIKSHQSQLRKLKNVNKGLKAVKSRYNKIQAEIKRRRAKKCPKCDRRPIWKIKQARSAPCPTCRCRPPQCNCGGAKGGNHQQQHPVDDMFAMFAEDSEENAEFNPEKRWRRRRRRRRSSSSTSCGTATNPAAAWGPTYQKYLKSANAAQSKFNAASKSATSACNARNRANKQLSDLKRSLARAKSAYRLIQSYKKRWSRAVAEVKRLRAKRCRKCPPRPIKYHTKPAPNRQCGCNCPKIRCPPCQPQTPQKPQQPQVIQPTQTIQQDDFMVKDMPKDDPMPKGVEQETAEDFFGGQQQQQGLELDFNAKGAKGEDNPFMY